MAKRCNLNTGFFIQEKNIIRWIIKHLSELSYFKSVYYFDN